MKTRFKDLSASLKTLVVLGWIFATIDVAYFVYGFILGLKYGLGY